MATKKIKTQKVGNSERMVISGNPVKDLKRTSSVIFAGANTRNSTYATAKDYRRNQKHKGQNNFMNC